MLASRFFATFFFATLCCGGLFATTPAARPSAPMRKRADRRALLEEANKSLRIYTEKDFKDILERFDGTYSALLKFTEPYMEPLFRGMHL